MLITCLLVGVFQVYELLATTEKQNSLVYCRRRGRGTHISDRKKGYDIFTLWGPILESVLCCVCYVCCVYCAEWRAFKVPGNQPTDGAAEKRASLEANLANEAYSRHLAFGSHTRHPSANVSYDVEFRVGTYHDDEAHKANNSVPLPRLSQIVVAMRIDRMSRLLAAHELLTDPSHSVRKALQQLHEHRGRYRYARH